MQINARQRALLLAAARSLNGDLLMAREEGTPLLYDADVSALQTAGYLGKPTPHPKVGVLRWPLTPSGREVVAPPAPDEAIRTSA